MEHQRRAAAEAFIASLNQLGASLELSEEDPIDLASSEDCLPPQDQPSPPTQASSRPELAKSDRVQANPLSQEETV